MKKYFLTMAILALGFSACNKVEIENQVVPEETPAMPTVYQVRIPATIGADTKAVDFSGTDPDTGKPTAVSTFVASDKVYVYNETKDVMACDAEGEPLVLTPEDITDGGKNCTLTARSRSINTITIKIRGILSPLMPPTATNCSTT